LGFWVWVGIFCLVTDEWRSFAPTWVWAEGFDWAKLQQQQQQQQQQHDHFIKNVWTV